MRLIQFQTPSEGRKVAIVDETNLRVLSNTETVYQLALDAIAANRQLAEVAEERATGETADYDDLESKGQLLPPLDHPESSRTFVTGTGLTHLGSADARDKMHQQAAEVTDENMTDSMKMFQWGVGGGKPDKGHVGVQPEWFYKGDGASVVAPGAAYPMPPFSLDGGEEPEIAGLYVIAPDGTPWRVGFAVGNEFSDHITERQNYLYLAHSKLRVCSYGPEVLLGDLPDNVEGCARVVRDGDVIWEKPFVSGEANMSHTIANLEHHHFKYDMFRQPGDVHIHFFGTATLSFSDGISVQKGDIFELEANDFGRPLRNALEVSDGPQGLVEVKAL